MAKLLLLLIVLEIHQMDQTVPVDILCHVFLAMEVVGVLDVTERDMFITTHVKVMEGKPVKNVGEAVVVHIVMEVEKKANKIFTIIATYAGLEGPASRRVAKQWSG